MLPLAGLGLILWILLLLWWINTKTVAMPVKGEESPSGCDPPPAEEEVPSTQSPHPGDSLQVSGASGVKTLDAEAPQASSEVNSEKPSLPPTAQNPSRTKVPMLSSGPEARERLKFILGASEDNSSDEEPLVTKPPSGASQPQTSTDRASPQQASSAAPQSSSSGIK